MSCDNRYFDLDSKNEEGISLESHFIYNEDNIPIVKVHENMKVNNANFYNSHLKVVKEYIKEKKSKEYKKYLLLEKNGFNFFEKDYYTKKTLYKNSLKVVRIYDYYKKKYPNMQFITKLPAIYNYSYNDVSKYKNVLEYEALIKMNKNIDSIDFKDYDIVLKILRDDGIYLEINNLIGKRFNILDILKRNKIDINVNKDNILRISGNNLNDKEIKFISNKIEKIDYFHERNTNKHNISLELNIHSPSLALSHNMNFGIDGDGKSNNSKETIFLKKVRHGYLITNIVGDNGSISFSRFKELMGDSKIDYADDYNNLYPNDRDLFSKGYTMGQELIDNYFN